MSPISFSLNPSDRFFGVAQNPYDRLGLESLLPSYQIISTQPSAWTATLTQAGIHIATLANATADDALVENTRQVLESPQLRAYLHQQCPSGTNCHVLVYKNDARIAAAAAELPIKLLANDPAIRWRLENKANLRTKFGQKLPFPRHHSVIAATIPPTKTQFNDWQRELGQFVMQDEVLSDGKGTYFVTTFADYKQALQNLQRYPRHRLVISEYITGEVASFQLCLTRYGAFSSPIQQQLFNHPALTAPIPRVEKFCGGQWNCQSYSSAVQQQISAISRTLDEELTNTWRGILGVDLIITPDDRVYVIEVNARLTGLTPPLALLQRQVNSLNFLLLHALELADIPYTLDEPDTLQQQWQAMPTASYVLPHNRHNKPVHALSSLVSGVYDVTPDTLTFRRPGYSFEHLQSPTEIVIPDVPDTFLRVPPGRRLPRILSQQPAVDDTGHLTPLLQRAISFIEENFVA